MGIQNGSATMKKSMNIPKKKKRLLCDPAIPLLDVHPKGLDTRSKRDINNSVPLFIAAVFTVAKI